MSSPDGSFRPRLYCVLR